MSRVRTEAPKTVKYNSGSIGRRVGEDTNGWRCLQCTFHNTQDVCTMCGMPKPKVLKPIKNKNNAKPYIEEKKVKKPEGPSETYYDPTDGSFNVPIAGIKKYDHKPGKNNVNPTKQPQSKAPASNIVTLDSLKSSGTKSEKKEEKKIDGRRDLLGLLQDAASDEPLPCMRKPKNKK